MRIKIHRLRPIVQIAVAISLMASPVGVGPIFAAKAPKLTDTCASFRKPFTDLKDYQLKKIIGGVVGGALVGALGGFLKDQIAPQYQRDANGNVQKKSSVLTGALTGAVAGGLVGWFTSLKKTAQNQEELQRAVNANLHQDVDQYSSLGQGLADLGNCRRTQIFATQQAFQRHEIDAKTAGQQLDTLDKWIVKDDQIISSASKMQSKTIGTYASATVMADGQDPETVKNNGDQMALATVESQSAAYEPAIVESYDTADTTQVVAAAEPETMSETRYVRARQSKGVSLRSAAQPDAPVVLFLTNGSPVETTPSDTEGWLTVTSGDSKGYIKESLLSSDAPSGRPAPVRAKPAPKPKPKPGTAIQKLAYVAPRRQPVKARDQAKVAVANLNGVNTLVKRNSQATSDQMRAARLALEG